MNKKTISEVEYGAFVKLRSEDGRELLDCSRCAFLAKERAREKASFDLKYDPSDIVILSRVRTTSFSAWSLVE